MKAPAVSGRVRLGQCGTKREALHKIEYWAPKGAKYYRLLSLGRDRRSGYVQPRSPYFEFEVEYATRAQAGFRSFLVGAYDDPILMERARVRWQRRDVRTRGV